MIVGYFFSLMVYFLFIQNKRNKNAFYQDASVVYIAIQSQNTKINILLHDNLKHHRHDYVYAYALTLFNDLMKIFLLEK